MMKHAIHIHSLSLTLSLTHGTVLPVPVMSVMVRISPSSTSHPDGATTISSPTSHRVLVSTVIIEEPDRTEEERRVHVCSRSRPCIDTYKSTATSY